MQVRGGVRPHGGSQLLGGRGEDVGEGGHVGRLLAARLGPLHLVRVRGGVRVRVGVGVRARVRVKVRIEGRGRGRGRVGLGVHLML